ncbi:MAG: hemagglutinin repeat-containing protein, partial [Moraxellaceae bacterium]|nr:hemagglutinin repeat-containing protein [Moraxellaceae bacterium]
VLSISADNVNQHGGRLQGDALLVDAQRDINNVGGSMTAKDVMWLNAGGDVNLTSTTQSNEVAVGASRFERTTIDRVAGLYVSGESDGLMVVNAGGDINATASIISNQSQNGQTLLDAAVAINLKTLKTTESEHIVWTQNQDKRRTESSSQEVGTVIRGAGDVALNAGENLNARAAQVAAGEVLQLSAGQDISIEAGRATEHLDVYQHRERRSTFSKSSTTIHNKDSRDEAVASNLEGAVVDMQAGNDLSLKGSTIISDNLTRLQAGNDINIIADENHYVDKQFTERKKSGFSASFSAGTASVGYGKSQESNNRESQSTTASASGVMSLAGDTELVAGNTLTIAGSDVAAGNNVALMAKEVELRAAQENLAIQQQQQRKSSGISVGVVVNPIAAFESAYDKRRDAATSPVGQVMAIADAAQDVVDANGVRIGSQKSSAAQNTEISTARVSTVQAGGNLNIMASDGSIVSEGARLSAEGNALLLAKENIVLGVAENTEGQRSNSRSSGWSVGASSMPVGINQGRATGQGDTVTASGSTLSVGGDATLATTHGDVRVTGSQAV